MSYLCGSSGVGLAKRNPLGATGLHDSSFDSVQVSILDRSCQVRVVGVCGDLAEGTLADISCRNLESFFLVLDSHELSESAWPGNIQDGHFDGEDGACVLRLFLAGGMLEARGGSLGSELPSAPEHSPGPVGLAGAGIRLDGTVAHGLHSAVLTGFCHSAANKQFTAQLLVLRDAETGRLPESPERISASVCFEGVRSSVVRFDATAMVEHERFGNVASCVVDEGRGVFWLYLLNGIVEIEARAAILSF